MATIHAAQAAAHVREACAARLRRNGIDPDDVVQIDLLPLRLARIHEFDRDEHGARYAIGHGDELRIACKRPYVRWLPRR